MSPGKGLSGAGWRAFVVYKEEAVRFNACFVGFARFVSQNSCLDANSNYIQAPAVRAQCRAYAAAPTFHYQNLWENATEDETPYRLITTEGVSTVEVEGRKVKYSAVTEALLPA